MIIAENTIWNCALYAVVIDINIIIIIEVIIRLVTIIALKYIITLKTVWHWAWYTL